MRLAKWCARWRQEDSRIPYLPLSHAGRISVVSNVALRAARGKYIAILADDDVWIDSDKLKKQVAYLEQHSECVVCSGGCRLVNESGERTSDVYKPVSDAAIRKLALRANPIVNSAAMFRRTAGVQYDADLSGFADWEFWLTLGRHGEFYNFRELFVAYRIWGQGGSFVNQRLNAVSALEIVRNHRNNYSGYFQAIWMARLFWLYTFTPGFFRRTLNPHLTRLKKRIFAAPS